MLVEFHFDAEGSLTLPRVAVGVAMAVDKIATRLADL